jgi:hypothetical protein
LILRHANISDEIAITPFQPLIFTLMSATLATLIASFAFALRHDFAPPAPPLRRY